MTFVKFHKDLIVYQKAFSAAMEIYVISKTFPQEERYSLTDQLDGPLVQLMQILQKRGEKGDMKNHSLANSMMQMLKQQKLKTG